MQKLDAGSGRETGASSRWKEKTPEALSMRPGFFPWIQPPKGVREMWSTGRKKAKSRMGKKKPRKNAREQTFRAKFQIHLQIS
jgi:hypothetical protein